MFGRDLLKAACLRARTVFLTRLCVYCNNIYCISIAANLWGSVSWSGEDARFSCGGSKTPLLAAVAEEAKPVPQ